MSDVAMQAPWADPIRLSGNAGVLRAFANHTRDSGLTGRSSL